MSFLLALTAARHKGMKTLLIDCVLRRSVIHKFFTMERAPGLSGILARGLGTDDCIRKTAVETLDVITAGEATPPPILRKSLTLKLSAVWLTR